MCDLFTINFTDLKPLNESIRKLKAIELCGDYPPVGTVLSALSGQVEELKLAVGSEVCCPFQCLCTYSEQDTYVRMYVYICAQIFTDETVIFLLFGSLVGVNFGHTLVQCPK